MFFFVSLIIKKLSQQTTQLRSVLSYAYHNSVESFFESCLDICLSLLQGVMAARRGYREGKDAASEAAYLYTLQQCAPLLNNVELYAKLSVKSDAADTAAVCLMLCAQLYCDCDFAAPAVEPEVQLREVLLGSDLRALLRACLSEHCNKSDTHSVNVTHCVLRTLLAAIPSPTPQATQIRESCIRIIQDDELLLGCIRETQQLHTGVAGVAEVWKVKIKIKKCNNYYRRSSWQGRYSRSCLKSRSVLRVLRVPPVRPVLPVQVTRVYPQHSQPLLPHGLSQLRARKAPNPPRCLHKSRRQIPQRKRPRRRRDAFLAFFCLLSITLKGSNFSLFFVLV